MKVRNLLEKQIASYPELFPTSIPEGYTLAGCLPESVKQPGVRLRQLVTRDNTKWTLRPSFVTPYMTAQIKDLEGPWLLMSYTRDVNFTVTASHLSCIYVESPS